MLYADYSKKMGKVAAFLGYLRRFRFVILAIFAAIIAVTIALMGARGAVYDTISCPAEIEYGESLLYRAGGFLSDIEYQYLEEGETEWTTEFPKRAGKFYVRAVSHKAFGNDSYGKVHTFTVKPKITEIGIAPTVRYGELPTMEVETQYGDTVTCDEFEYGDISAVVTTVKPVMSAIRVTSTSGEDVTASYEFVLTDSSVTVIPRAITFEADGASKIYDGTPLACDTWRITGGTLVSGDSVSVTFDRERTDVGETENTPTLKIIRDADSENPIDVTRQYAITQDIGKLVVTKREIAVTTSSAEREYDGTALSSPEYSLTGDMPLVDGDRLEISEYADITAVGTVDNKMVLRVLNEEGEDVTDNYSLDYTYGTLTVDRRKILFDTASDRKIYDGLPLSNNDFTFDAERLLDGHGARVTEGVYITDVGSADNAVTISVFDGDGNDISSSCYEISYTYGTLTVDKRPVVLVAGDAQKIYDGTPLVSDAENLTAEQASDENSGLLDGHRLSAEFVGAVTDVGSAVNAISVPHIFDGEIEVTDNYDITDRKPGTLTVTPRPVTVLTATTDFVYDGEAHFDTSYTVIVDEDSGMYDFVEGHGLTAIAHSYATVTTVFGESGNKNEIENVVAYEVTGTDGGNYTITVEYGTLTVSQRKMTVSVKNDLTKVYDDTTLSNTDDDNFTWTEFDGENNVGLVKGQRVASVAFFGEITGVGSTDNEIYGAVIVDANNADVTENYSISYENGKLTVTPRPITISVRDNLTKVYDDTPLTNTDEHNYIWSEFDGANNVGLVTGHDIVSVAFEGTITNAGSVDNVISNALILRGYTDVTDNYEITYVKGTLTVTSRHVHIKTATTDFIYLGDCQYDTNYEYIIETENDHKLVLMHFMRVDEYATITDVYDENGKKNEIENAVKYRILKSDGDKEVDVSDNYELEVDHGVLTMSPRPLTLEVKDKDLTHVYDGTVFKNTDPNNFVPSEYDQFNFKGLLPGHTVGEAVFDGEIKNAGSTDNNIVSCKITADADGKDVTTNYDITYIGGTLTVTPRPVTITSGSAEWVYDGYGRFCHEFTTENFLDIEPPTISVLRNVTHARDVLYDDNGKVSSYDNILEYSITGIDLNNYDITYVWGKLTVTPRPITISVKENLTRVYDGTPLKNTDPNNFTWTPFDREKEIGLVNNQSIVSVVFSGEITDVGTADNIIGDAVITAPVDFDVTKNYVISYEKGTLTVTQRPITISVKEDLTKVYDGTPLKNTDDDNFTWTEFDGEKKVGLVTGHSIVSVKFGGEITDVGSTDNIISEAVIEAADGTNVNKNYLITYGKGTLIVTARKITITTQSQEFVYDDKPHSNTDVIVGGDGVAPGQTLEIKNPATVTHVSDGKISNSLTLSDIDIEDSDGNSVLSNYAVTFDNKGVLTVIPRKLSITTGTESFVYDGEEHSCEKFEVTSELKPVEGHKLTVVTAAKVKYVSEGEVENKLTFIVVDSEDTAVQQEDYDLTDITYGKISVTPRPVTITSGSDEWVYDGNGHENINVIIDNFLKSEPPHIVVTDDTIVTDVLYGEDGKVAAYDNILEYEITGIDFSNYDITYVWGKLTVTPRPITISVKDDLTKVYDGTPLKNTDPNNFTWTPFDREKEIGLVNNQSIVSVVFSGEQTDAGVGKNIISDAVIEAADGKDVTKNYKISYVEGKLTVTPRPITISVKEDLTKVYDGTPLKNTDPNNFTWTEFDGEKNVGLVTGHSIVSVKFGGEITDVGSTDNIISEAVIEAADGTNVKKNYLITYGKGTLTVTKRTVNISLVDTEKVYSGLSTECDVTVTVGGGEQFATLLSDLGHSVDIVYDKELPVRVLRNADGDVISTEIHIASASITDNNGADKSGNYDIVFDKTAPGRIKITPRPLYITTANREWEYDGVEHYWARYEVGEESDLPSTDSLSVTKYSTITEIGEKPNELSFGAKHDTLGDVTDCYEFNITCGTLRIAEGSTIRVPVSSIMNIISQNGGELYMRLESGGGYNGSTTWDEAPEYTALSYNGKSYGAYYLTGYLLSKAGAAIDTVQVQLDPDGNRSYYFVLPYDMTLFDTNRQTSDVFAVPEETLFQTENRPAGCNQFDLTYAAEYYAYDYLTQGAPLSYDDLPNTDAFKAYEAAYRTYVKNTYTGLPESTLRRLGETAAQFAGYTDVKQKIQAVADFVKGLSQYDRAYMLYNSDDEGNSIDIDHLSDLGMFDMAAEFVTGKYRGVCRHYATTATALFRALGIPARYVVGVAAVTEPNKVVGINELHAWTEVYIDGFGWVRIEVTPDARNGGSGGGSGDDNGNDDGNGNGGSGSGEDEGKGNISEIGGDGDGDGEGELPPDALVFYMPSDEKAYDGVRLFGRGLELSRGNYEASAVSPTLAGMIDNGYSLSVTSFGSQLLPGVSDNKAYKVVFADPSGKDVTNEYKFYYKPGELTVYGVITVISSDHTVMYDGQEHVYSDHTLDYSLPEGWSLTHTPKTVTNVADSGLNVPNISVTGNGADMTEHFRLVTDDCGNITVTARPITIEVINKDINKLYDGTPLSNTDPENYRQSEIFGEDNMPLVDGHRIVSVTFSGEQTEVGSTENAISDAVITDGFGNVVSDNYDVHYINGMLTVNGNPVTIAVKENLTKVYDGTPLKNTDPENYEATGLADGHRVTDVVFDGEITNVGMGANDIVSYKIVDGEGKDVTSTYSVTTVPGELNVVKRKLTIATDSQTWYYDGKPHSAPKITGVTDTAFETGESAVRLDFDLYNTEIREYTEVTDIGFWENVLVVAVILGENPGEDVTENFEIIYDNGTLEIIGTQEPADLFRVKSDSAGVMYFRQSSYGEYTGSTSWNAVPEYAGVKISSGGKEYSVNYLASILLERAGLKRNTVTVEESSSGAYSLPYYLTLADNERQLSDVWYTPNGDSADYTVYNYMYDYMSDNGATLRRASLGDYAATERSYREYVYSDDSGYLSMPAGTRDGMLAVIAAQGFNASSNTIVSDVVRYVSNIAKYNLKYDRALDRESDVALAFLGGNYEGVCRHFATSATMLFRALGIPARYTVGAMQYVAADTWRYISSDRWHAWTEVYLDGIGWVAVDATGSMSGGDDDNTQILSVTPNNVTVAYEGVPVDASVTNNGVEVNGLLNILMRRGYTLEYTLDGRLDAPGTTKITVSSYSLKDGDGNDVTGEYIWETKSGTLEVVEPERIITVALYGMSKTYDGTPLTIAPELFPGFPSYECYELPNGVSAVTLDIEKYGFTGVGEVSSQSLTDLFASSGWIHVFDENGVDVTEDYTVEIEIVGTLAVRVREITITASDVTKPYDGTPIDHGSITVGGKGLVAGHRAEVEYSDAIIDIGTEPNRITRCTIYDADGNDVTACYDITAYEGTLTIT